MNLLFGVNNLRSIESMDPIELRPITILVGRNCVGKSTLLRTIPLLRQSLDVWTSSPILWYGDYVDFGDYATAVNQSNPKDGISFEFGMRNFEFFTRADEFAPPYYLPRELRYFEKKISAAELKIFIKKFKVNEIRKEAQLKIHDPDLDVRFVFANNGEFSKILIDDEEIPISSLGIKLNASTSNIFSRLYLREHSEDKKFFQRRSDIIRFIFDYTVQEMLSFAESDVSREDIVLEPMKLLKITNLTQEDFEKLSKQTKNPKISDFYKEVAKVNKDGSPKEDFIILKKLSKLFTAVLVYDYISNVFTDSISNSTYIGPSRVNSERYYRVQNLQIREVSSDGKNLPFFLDSLSSRQRKNFSDWINRLFEFEIKIKRSGGHIQILVKENETMVNLKDTGFGLTQLLPILAQFWWIITGARITSNRRYSYIRGKSDYSYRIISMEQPELHLHPAHQEELGTALVKTLNDCKSENKSESPLFIIETHSDSLIAQIGELIEAGEISKDDVQVLVFSRDEGEPKNKVKIKSVEYNDKGYLLELPTEFLGNKTC